MNPKKVDKMATSVLYIISGIIVVILASLLLYILVRGVAHISWHFLTSPSKAYEVGGGIGIQLFNSIFLLVITMIISFPLSLGAGIYLSEYANQKSWVTNLVRTSIEILSSLPSVVVGLFGFLIFVVPNSSFNSPNDSVLISSNSLSDCLSKLFNVTEIES